MAKGIEFPRVGLGTLRITDMEVAINAAIDAGYRAIDTAEGYHNEEQIGAALKKVFAAGKVKREDLFITTKLHQHHHRPGLVERSLRLSLQRLGLDYVDLYLIHWPFSLKPKDDLGDEVFINPNGDGKGTIEHIDIIDTWIAMEEVQKLGLTRLIGVSNFSIETLERMQFHPRVTVQPFCNQVELHLYCQQVALTEYCEPRKIRLISYMTFGREREGPFGVKVLEDPELKAVAEEVKKTPSQVALQFVLQLSPLIHVIPKSSTPARIAENFALDFTLSDEQMGKLKARNRMHRMATPVALFGIEAFGLGLGP